MSCTLTSGVKSRAVSDEQPWRKDDPILCFSDTLVEAGVISEEEYEEMDRAAISEVEEAAAFADESPLPEPADLYRYLYSDVYPHGVNRRDLWR